ncbi:porin [Limnohabitans sp. MMS-10A-192]|uniref:porin n=1 Tax=Limnohabitans sp. MMS-10A-192 TaxID=1835769 RepID=UPI001304ADC4|nr:porin [Limnohabitans sp. MMS-10A-192]
MAATGAFAQSSVQIDGVVDVGYQAINYKGGKVNGIGNNGSSTSQINFRGTEDLGGGLKANFRVETDWNTVSNKGNTGSASTPVTLGNETVAAASTFGNGEIRVGLAGGFGSIDAGAVNYNTLGTYLTGQPFGTAIGSGFRTFYVNDAQGTSQVRSDNSVKYVSPSFSGLNASLYYAGKQTKANGTADAGTPGAYTAVGVKDTSFGGLGAYDMQGTTELGINYANGPLAASFSSLKQDYKQVGTGTTDSTVNTLGANYAFGAAKLFGLYQTNKTNTSSTNNKAMTISGTYTMGAVVLMAQVGELKADAGTYSGQKSKLVALGADYNLSKRTAVYFRAESIDDKARAMNGAVNPQQIGGAANVAALTDQKFGRTSVGVRHAF